MTGALFPIVVGIVLLAVTINVMALVGLLRVKRARVTDDPEGDLVAC